MTVHITLRMYAGMQAKYRRPCMQVPLFITGNLRTLYAVFRTQNTGVSVRCTQYACTQNTYTRQLPVHVLILNYGLALLHRTTLGAEIYKHSLHP